ncbi:MAG TPA: AAA family ATPase [Acidimicrobiales bacterium]
MGNVLALANQKGGVAKTTSAHSLATALSDLGHRVLLVDLDPQASLTWACGLDPDGLDASIHDVLLGRTKAKDVVVPLDRANRRAVGPPIDLLPSTIDLAGAEMHLLTKTGREYVLRRALAPLVDRYRLVLLDCAPSLGILTINALTAADEVLIPLQCESLGLRGVTQLLETIDDVRSYTNPDLRIRGAIATLFDGRTKLAHEVVAAARDQHGLEVLEPPIPKSVKVAEAPGRGRSVLDHAPRSPSAEAYRQIAAQLVSRKKRS